MSETQEEMSDNEVEVVAVVPFSREPEDVWECSRSALSYMFEGSQ